MLIKKFGEKSPKSSLFLCVRKENLLFVGYFFLFFAHVSIWPPPPTRLFADIILEWSHITEMLAKSRTVFSYWTVHPNKKILNCLKVEICIPNLFHDTSIWVHKMGRHVEFKTVSIKVKSKQSSLMSKETSVH